MNLDHVTLPADDYAASLAFYLALGLHQIVAAPPRYARSEMEGGATRRSKAAELPAAPKSI